MSLRTDPHRDQALIKKQVFIFPASFAQQRLWFLDQLAPGISLFNLSLAVRIDGDGVDLRAGFDLGGHGRHGRNDGDSGNK